MRSSLPTMRISDETKNCSPTSRRRVSVPDFTIGRNPVNRHQASPSLSECWVNSARPTDITFKSKGCESPLRFGLGTQLVYSFVHLLLIVLVLVHGLDGLPR